MKKLISLVMAAAMVLSLVPATAFAASASEVSATAKVVKAWERTENFTSTTDVGLDGTFGNADDVVTVGGIRKLAAAPATDAAVPELQLKVSAVDYLVGGGTDVSYKLVVSLDNAELLTANAITLAGFVSVVQADGKYVTTAPAGGVQSARRPLTVTASAISTDEVTFTINDTAVGAKDGRLQKDDIIIVKLDSKMKKTSAGQTATVSVDSDAIDADDLVYATVLDTGITASVKKTVDVAVEEVKTLDSHGVKIKSAVGDFVAGQTFELKLSNGFEFSKVKNAATYNFDSGVAAIGTAINVNDKVVRLEYTGTAKDFTIAGGDIEIEATTAKAGAVATLTVKAVKYDWANAVIVAGAISASSSVEIAKVCDYTVNLTVDADEDVPVIYSGTNIANAGLTDDSDHLSLEVTAKETFPGAWSMRQGFNFNLPEGVYVADTAGAGGVVVDDGVIIKKADNFLKNGLAADTLDWQEAFFAAYREGDHKNFEFKKRVFDDVNNLLAPKAAELTFQLRLVADPTFEGDVVLTFEGALVETQSVTIAKFVKPYTVKAEQNDVIIDYRNTKINTAITITEAEAGLWKKDTIFAVAVEKGTGPIPVIEFEDDATFEADADSEMELNGKTTNGGALRFAVKSESDAAATVTISDMELFMQRNIPAGSYDLEIDDITNTIDVAYLVQPLYAGDTDTITAGVITKAAAAAGKDCLIGDVEDYSRTVKEAFVNVVTSGRDQDNLFTTKVVVPVGEGYLVAGETKVTLDAPAYISAAGYTMLPVRAVSRALGVDTNNVLWSAETKTVTIMFAQRIISMTVGQKTIYVNGSAIPSSAAPEIKDGRTFLPLRDLGTALGVTNVSWDSATKTATLN